MKITITKSENFVTEEYIGTSIENNNDGQIMYCMNAEKLKPADTF